MIGERAGARELATDWILTHELFHLGVPSFWHEGRWLDEGLATYYEPVLRTRSARSPPMRSGPSSPTHMPRGLAATRAAAEPRSDSTLLTSTDHESDLLGRRDLRAPRQRRDPPAHGRRALARRRPPRRARPRRRRDAHLERRLLRPHHRRSHRLDRHARAPRRSSDADRGREAHELDDVLGALASARAEGGPRPCATDAPLASLRRSIAHGVRDAPPSQRRSRRSEDLTYAKRGAGLADSTRPRDSVAFLRRVDATRPRRRPAATDAGPQLAFRCSPRASRPFRPIAAMCCRSPLTASPPLRPIFAMCSRFWLTPRRPCGRSSPCVPVPLIASPPLRPAARASSA